MTKRQTSRGSQPRSRSDKDWQGGEDKLEMPLLLGNPVWQGAETSSIAPSDTMSQSEMMLSPSRPRPNPSTPPKTIVTHQAMHLFLLLLPRPRQTERVSKRPFLKKKASKRIITIKRNPFFFFFSCSIWNTTNWLLAPTKGCDPKSRLKKGRDGKERRRKLSLFLASD